jgi:hypothetical protein
MMTTIMWYAPYTAPYSMGMSLMYTHKLMHARARDDALKENQIMFQNWIIELKDANWIPVFGDIVLLLSHFSMLLRSARMHITSMYAYIYIYMYICIYIWTHTSSFHLHTCEVILIKTPMQINKQIHRNQTTLNAIHAFKYK